MTDLIHCPRCTATMEVSEEDPVATQSEMLDHLYSHTAYDRQAALMLLARCRITTQASQ